MKINQRLCLVLCLLMILLIVAGCSRQINMNTVLEEPHFAGVITEVYEKSILVKVNDNEEVRNSSDLLDVSLDVELKDGLSDYNIGDEVCVYYNGQLAGAYPAQVRRVYAILILKEAERGYGSSSLKLTQYKITDEYAGVSVCVPDSSTVSN